MLIDKIYLICLFSVHNHNNNEHRAHRLINDPNIDTHTLTYRKKSGKLA